MTNRLLLVLVELALRVEGLRVAVTEGEHAAAEESFFDEVGYAEARLVRGSRLEEGSFGEVAGLGEDILELLLESGVVEVDGRGDVVAIGPFDLASCRDGVELVICHGDRCLSR